MALGGFTPKTAVGHDRVALLLTPTKKGRITGVARLGGSPRDNQHVDRTRQSMAKRHQREL
jgi:hypothetical protein